MQNATTKPATTILRFRRSERLLHWSIALPFLGCLSTALFLVFLNETETSGLLRDLISRTHKVFGICLIICPLIVLTSHWYDIWLHMRNIKEGWTWSRDDIRWILLMPVSLVFLNVSLPEEGKFNAGEKINFMMTMIGYFCFAMTGLFILYQKDVFLSSSIHFFVTMLSFPVVIGHIFMATMNPDTRKGLTGMITGFVDRDWARHHYRRWFCEEFTSAKDEMKGQPLEPTGKTVDSNEQPSHSEKDGKNGLLVVVPGILLTGLLFLATILYVTWLSPFGSG